MIRVILGLSMAAVLLLAGCNGGSSQALYTTPNRLANGLVVILPGIEGESSFNHDIRRGLNTAAGQYALPIYHWGRPIPGAGLFLNQVDFLGNRLAGVRIAKMIQQYQVEHPGQPVYIVGHSGGGGIAVFVAEAMPEGKQVDGLVLLSASIWAGYDLTKALSHCRSGIANFYNEADVALLGIGTTLLSNVDGMKGPSAGLVSFDRPKDSDPEEKKLAYRKLYQVRIRGGDDPHSVATRPSFVSRHVAPWIITRAWPAGSAVRAARLDQLPPPIAEAIALLHRP